MSADLQKGFSVIEGNGERFVPLSDVSDLRTPECQEVLTRIRRLRAIPVCGCGLTTGSRRALHVHKLPMIDPLSLYRNDASEHAFTCWRGLSGDGNDADFVYSSSIFRALPASKQPFLGTWANADEAISDHREHFQFGRFCSHVLSPAQIEALAVENAEWPIRGFRPLQVTELFRQIDLELRRSPFLQGSAYAAACAEGGDLRFGIITTDAKTCDFAAGALLNIQWWHHGILCHETVVVAPRVWAAAVASIQCMGDPQRAPYVCFAVIEPAGLVRCLRLFPCYCDGKTFNTNDSGSENGFNAHLSGLNHCVVKPVLRGDTNRFFERLSLFRDQPIPRICYRPDYVIIERRAGRSWRCFIVELRGFKPGQIPAYDAHYELKKDYFSSLDPRIHFISRNGWDYSRPTNNANDIQWRSLGIDWWGPSVAAQNWNKKGRT